MTITPATIPRMGRRRKLVDQSTYSGRVAVRLRELRERAGKSVEEVAKALKIPPSSYYNYENGRTEPPLNSFRKIATILGVNVRNLFPKD